MTAENGDALLRNIESRLLALEQSFDKLRAAIGPALGTATIAAPIAASLLKVDGQHAFSARFFALLDLGEAVVKYSAAIAFASVIHTKSSLADNALEFFKKPPSLGKLVEQLRNILDDTTSPAVWPLNLVFETFRKPNGKQTPAARYFLDEFITIRNSERGHGTQQPEGYYEGLYLKNRSIIEDFVLSSVLLSTTLIYIHGIDHYHDQYSYTITQLMGPVPIQAADPIISPIKVRMHSTCLWDRGSSLLPLDDFVVYRFCGQCKSEHIFFADCITSDKIQLQSYPGSHKVIEARK